MNILNALFGAGTWGAGGNLVAWVLCGIIGTLLTLLFRKPLERAGQRLAKWWGRHAKTEFAAEFEALKHHVTAEVDESHRKILATVEDRHRDLVNHVSTQSELLKAHVADAVKPPMPPPATAGKTTPTRKGSSA